MILRRSSSCASLFSFILLNAVYSNAHASDKIKLAHRSPKIVEQLLLTPPGKTNSMSIEPEVVMPPMRSIAEFKGITSTLPDKTTRPWCGPSPKTNTLNCFDLNESGNYLQSFPLPGKLSSTPLYYERSWLLGTSKGFLIRVNANRENNNLPQLEKDNFKLWGSHSREVMANYKPKTIYTESESTSEIASLRSSSQPILTSGIQWIFNSASPFIGTPVIKDGFVYAFSSSQYFQAFNWETGKLIWAARLAPASNLRLNSNAFQITSSAIYVGNSLGSLMALNPTDGTVLWTWQVPSATNEERLLTKLPAGPDRFYGIVASPLVLKNILIVSNAESMTQAVSLSSHASVWSYPAGSVTKPRLYKKNVLLGTSDGKLVSLDAITGVANWTTKITKGSPIMSLMLTKNNNYLYVTTHLGQIFLINPETGKIITNNNPIGEIIGDFEPGFGKSEACLSFISNRFRCFRVVL